MQHLLERDIALDALRSSFRAASTGRGSVSLVVGEAGIGKTALVTCVVQECGDAAHVLWGRCDDLGTPRPLGAFRDVAGAMSGRFVEAIRAGRPAATIHRHLFAAVRGSDRPTVLVIEDLHLGSNMGPNAVELLLQGLAFCYAVGFAAYAAAKGIEIDSREYEIEGELDVRPFLGLAGQRPGFSKIRAVGRISSPNATPEQLEELCQYVQDTSLVRNSLANAVPVETTLKVL